MDTVDGQLFVTVLGIAGHPDRANDFAVRIADQREQIFPEGGGMLAAMR